MTSAPIPASIPATASDVSTHVMRSFSQHMDLGIHLDFDGRLDADTLARAVRLSLDAEPVLGCGLVARTFSASWDRRDDLDEHVPFSVLETDDPGAESIRFRTTTVGSEGPQVAVRLVRSPDGDRVSVAINHDVADGQGVKQYAYLLADLYTRLAADPFYVPEPHLTARPSARDVWANLSPERRRASSNVPSMVMPNWVLPSKGVTGGGRTIRELRVAPERFRAAKAYGADRGATVNALLLTSFFRAVARVYPPPAGQPMSLPFTVDYRRYLPAPEDVPIANLAVSIWLGVSHVPDEGLDATLARVGEQLAVWRDATWGVRGLMQATSIARLGYGPTKAIMGAVMGGSAKSGKTSPIFTNIGVLDEGRLSFAGVTPVSARLNGPAGFGASLVPTISTYADELTVSMGFCEQDMDGAAIDSVLSVMDTELGALAGA